MDGVDDEGLCGSVLIYMGIIFLSMAVLGVPIYVLTGPVTFNNDATSDLARAVKQPVMAAEDNAQPNAKAEAALKALLGRSGGAQLRAEAPVHQRVVPAAPTTQHIASTPAVVAPPTFAPL
jgi:hypothetical protein